MAPRKLRAQPIYLEPAKADLLDGLSEQTRIPKAVLLREAVDDLLVKHGAEAPAAAKGASSKRSRGGRKPGK